VRTNLKFLALVMPGIPGHTFEWHLCHLSWVTFSLFSLGKPSYIYNFLIHRL
jgi:hypothetical protein